MQKIEENHLMRSFRWGAFLAALIGLALAPNTVGADESEAGFERTQPEDVKWKPLPGYEGVRVAVMAGDPSKAGLYVVRVNFPPGLMSRPHFHPDDRYAVVLKGTWWTGTGDTFDPATTVPVKAGGFMKHPAGGHHYDGAKDEEVILQLTGYGPTATTLIHPEDGHTGHSLK
jgi:quercetin dioxygenase-like cupin family protein